MPTKQEISDLQERVARMRKLAETHKEACKGGETATKNVLIQPFLKDVLGYDTQDPREVKTEYTADPTGKSSKKVDYAIMKGGDAVILIEAKAYGRSLSAKEVEQLRGYLEASKASLGILMDGVSSLFYGKHDRKVDEEPFFQFDLFEHTDDEISLLHGFTKKRLSKASLEQTVNELNDIALEKRHVRNVRDVILADMLVPTRPIVFAYAKRAGIFDTESNRKESKTTRFTRITQKAFEEAIAAAASKEDAILQLLEGLETPNNFRHNQKSRTKRKPTTKADRPRTSGSPAWNLLKMGIPKGAQIVFRDGEERATVESAKMVVHMGEKIYLTEVTEMLADEWPVNPLEYWSYKRRTLAKWHDEANMRSAPRRGWFTASTGSRRKTR